MNQNMINFILDHTTKDEKICSICQDNETASEKVVKV
jgi:hypothetical protein